MSSRWLVEVAEIRGLAVDWRSMSLAELNGGVENMPKQYQELGRFSVRALRMVEALRAAGLPDRIGQFYTELGTRLHVEGEAPGLDLLRNAANAAYVSEYLAAADDCYWDMAVAGSTHTAMELAGPDIGSPVLQLGERSRALHGPIVSPPPRGAHALALWDALVTLTRVPGFYELKHGRTGEPQVQATAVQVEQAAR
jgi:hypothetical protein